MDYPISLYKLCSYDKCISLGLYRNILPFRWWIDNN
jgi:hypothetical protein